MFGLACKEWTAKRKHGMETTKDNALCLPYLSCRSGGHMGWLVCYMPPGCL